MMPMKVRYKDTGDLFIVLDKVVVKNKQTKQEETWHTMINLNDNSFGGAQSLKGYEFISFEPLRFTGAVRLVEKKKAAGK